MSINQPIIVCPDCKSEIKLTESLAAPLLESTRKQYEERLAHKESEVLGRENRLKEQQAALAQAQASIEEQVAVKVARERVSVAAEEAKKAHLLVSTEMDKRAKEVADLQDVLKQRDIKLAEAQEAQAELIRKQRELDDAKREIELTIEKRVQQSLSGIRDQAKKEAEDQHKLTILERDQTISAMHKKIEELKQKAEQGSQQLQGEVQELELEALLRARFPIDSVEPVPKGEFGGDALHRIIGPTGQHCGSILWESKRTKSWSDGWLGKLRDDQRAAKAEIAIIVSQILPKDVDTFDFIDGVWITSPRTAIPVAIALRYSLVELANTRIASEGQQTKMEMVYRYLTGPSFRHRITAIVEKFTDMQADLEKERRTMTRLWAKREQQIRGVIETTAGLYGDLQGIAGKSLSEIEGLELEPLSIEGSTEVEVAPF